MGNYSSPNVLVLPALSKCGMSTIEGPYRQLLTFFKLLIGSMAINSHPPFFCCLIFNPLNPLTIHLFEFMIDEDRRITSITSALRTLSLDPSVSNLIWSKKEQKLREKQEKAREEELQRQTCK